MSRYHGMMLNRLTLLDSLSRHHRLFEEQQIADCGMRMSTWHRFDGNEIWESLRYSADAQGIEFINDLPGDLRVCKTEPAVRVVLSNPYRPIAIRYQ